MNQFDSLTTMIEQIVKNATKFHVPRMGIVSKVDDDTGKGRILVHIPMFGWMTDDTGVWCHPKDNARLTTPQKGDFVIVEFLDGNRDKPIYTGMDYKMKGMLPGSYDGISTTQVLYEDNLEEMSVTYDENGKALTVNYANGMTVVMDGTGIKVDLGKTDYNLTLTDAHGNELEMSSGGIKLDGSQIALNGSTKALTLHPDLDTALQTFVSTAFNTHIHTAPTGPTTPPVVPGSINISAAATTSVKTGG